MKPTRLLLQLALALAALTAQASVTAYHRAFGPKSLTRIATPTIQWEVWATEGGKVTAVEMTLNGKAVDATYLPKERVLEYTPKSPLAPGDYSVHAKVVVDGQLDVWRDWNFRVADNPLASLPVPDGRQLAMVEEVNAYRRRLGLPDAVSDDRLHAASQAHSEYLKQNRRIGHYEDASNPGFTGNSPSDRMEAFGYFGSNYEGVCCGAASIDKGVRDLYDAPYHRLPFMYPGRVLLGAGFSGGNLTLKFGIGDAAQVVVSPAVGESNVPCRWDGNERPNPLRMWSASGPTGYPIVLGAFGPRGKMAVARAVLSLEGAPVDAYVNTPANDDDLTDAMLIIPKLPLEPGRSYEVDVSGQMGDGKPFHRVWTFRTRDQRPSENG